MQPITIVDPDDNPIGEKPRSDITYPDIFRVAGLWITDLKTGDILLAQRKWTKRSDPGMWSAAAAGTVEAHETYQTNIVKEAEEELGLANLTVKLGPKQYIDDGLHKYFCQWFYAQIDKTSVKITIQEDEVEAVAWLTPSKLKADVATNPGKYAPSTKASLEVLILA